MLNLDSQSPSRRRPSLTPMIDVVFLLLVFFMLAARFGAPEALGIAGTSAGPGGAPWQGPPRLVTIAPDAVLLNGVPTGDLASALAPLMTSPEDVVILRPTQGTDVARLVAVAASLRAAGLTRIVVAGAR